MAGSEGFHGLGEEADDGEIDAAEGLNQTL